MPERDKYGRLAGILDIEEFTDGWRSRCVLLDEDKAKLKFFKGKETVEESLDDEPMKTIDLAYITKVAITTTKPKAPYCFEIHTASEKWYLRSHEESEINTWFKVLHKAAVNPREESDENFNSNIERSKGSVKSLGSNDGDEICYVTKIIGGIPVRTPKTNSGDSENMLANRSNSDSVTIVKQGFCVKQGAWVKSWKRRYFKLDKFKFCYYEKESDREPIHSVSANDLKCVKQHEGTFQNRSNVFEVETPQRTYYIQAEDEKEMHEWIKGFKQVIRSIRGQSTLETVSIVK